MSAAAASLLFCQVISFSPSSLPKSTTSGFSYRPLHYPRPSTIQMFDVGKAPTPTNINFGQTKAERLRKLSKAAQASKLDAERAQAEAATAAEDLEQFRESLLSNQFYQLAGQGSAAITIDKFRSWSEHTLGRTVSHEHAELTLKHFNSDGFEDHLLSQHFPGAERLLDTLMDVERDARAFVASPAGRKVVAQTERDQALAEVMAKEENMKTRLLSVLPYLLVLNFEVADAAIPPLGLYFVCMGALILANSKPERWFQAWLGGLSIEEEEEESGMSPLVRFSALQAVSVEVVAIAIRMGFGLCLSGVTVGYHAATGGTLPLDIDLQMLQLETFLIPLISMACWYSVAFSGYEGVAPKLPLVGQEVENRLVRKVLREKEEDACR